jgi:amidophosphoribosyltransferase
VCAIVGVFANKNSAKIASSALFAMQHRGQETTGISSCHKNIITTYKKKGLVSDVLLKKPSVLNKVLKGSMSIGHNRYSTAGKKSRNDSQPISATYKLGDLSIAHNGNFINKDEIREVLIQQGAIFQSQMDTENMIHLIAQSQKDSLQDRIIEVLDKVKGAYCMTIMSNNQMFVIRDKYGIRPLSLGKLSDGGYIVASETCALDLVGASFIRDVKAGEMLVFDKKDKKNFKSIQLIEPEYRPCAFEYIYFARPDSIIDGKNIYQVREAMGRKLAQETKDINVDIVIPVPDSGVPSAIGYSKEANIPFEMGILRNHYVGRTFIVPGQEERETKVKQKLTAMKDIIKGKKLVVIDDSIVRGTTSKSIVKILFNAGAKEVHFRVSSPPVKYPCFYGIDTPIKEELISSYKNIDEVCKYIGATSLAFLSIEGLNDSINTKRNYALESFNGEYFIK